MHYPASRDELRQDVVFAVLAEQAAGNKATATGVSAPRLSCNAYFQGPPLPAPVSLGFFTFFPSAPKAGLIWST